MPLEFEQFNEKFLETAQQLGKLSIQNAQLCREQLKQSILNEQNIQVSAIAIQQKFLTEIDVVQIYQAMQKDSNDVVYLVKINNDATSEASSATSPTDTATEQQIAEEILLEQKIINYIESNNLVAPSNIQFCLQEKKRLAKLGYPVQLSAILYNSHCLSLAAIQEMYKALIGQDVTVIQEKVAPDQTYGMPVIRRASIPKLPKQKQPKPAKVKAVKIKPVKATKIKPVKATKIKPVKATKIKPVKPAKHIEQEQDVVEVQTTTQPIEPTLQTSSPTTANDIYNTMSNLQATPGIQQANPDVINLLNNMMTILKKIEAQSTVAPTTTTIAPTTPPAVAKPSKSKKADETSPEEPATTATSEPSDHAELQELARGKTILDSAQAIPLLQKGEKLEDCYIADLTLAGLKFAKSVVLTNCVLENFDASNAQFEGNVDFEGSSFVGKAIFKSSIFAGDAKFSKAVFIDGADFSKTDFQGESKFHSTSFQRFVSFNRARFAKKVVFSYCGFAKGAKFNASEFLGQSSFNNLHCGHRFEMSECKFEDVATFSNAEFAEITDFSDAVFKQIVKFIGTVFAKTVSFKATQFDNDCIFQSASVEGDLLFNSAKFSGLINLQALSAEHNVNFKEAKILAQASFQVRDAYFGRLFITIPQLRGHLHSHEQAKRGTKHADEHYRVAREEYGLLKNNFREINEYDEEDWAYLWEKRTARKVSSIGKRFLEWLVLDIPCGYGTKTINIFPTLFVLFAIFAGVYFSFGSEFVGGIQTALEQPASPAVPIDPATAATQATQFPLTILESLQVSFCTLTNLSVGDIKPRQGSWMNYLLMFESFLGFLLMNVVVVVTFSRKVSR